MSEKIHMYDLTIFGDRIYKIQRPLFLLDTLVQIKDALNGLWIDKHAIATVLKKELSHHFILDRNSRKKRGNKVLLFRLSAFKPVFCVRWNRRTIRCRSRALVFF